MGNARCLKGTSFGISRDYPKEIADARPELWPDFKASRDRHGSRNVQIRFPAALVVNGDVVRDMFPGWHSILRGSRNSNVKARVNELFQLSIEESMMFSGNDVNGDVNDDANDANEGIEVVTEEPETIQASETQEISCSQEPGYLLNVHPPLKEQKTQPPNQQSESANPSPVPPKTSNKGKQPVNRTVAAKKQPSDDNKD